VEVTVVLGASVSLPDVEPSYPSGCEVPKDGSKLGGGGLSTDGHRGHTPASSIASPVRCPASMSGMNAMAFDLKKPPVTN
jgi:hypothetical protein